MTDSDRDDPGSYWLQGDRPSFPSVDRDLTVDVAIIGAGITGLTTAYLLKRAGLKVAVVERSRIARADTGHTTAHLTYVTDHRLSDLRSAFGDDHAQAAWDAGSAALDSIEETVGREGIDCGFQRVPGYLHLPTEAEASERQIDDLRREAEGARKLGFDAAYVDRVPLMAKPGIQFSTQARFHPVRYLSALAKAVDGDGSHIFEETNATEVRSDPLTVFAGTGAITCDFVVVATHNPIVGKANWLEATWLQTKLSLYTSYVVGGVVASGTVPDALFWDTADPYTYLRIQRQADSDLVILGGEDHKTGQDEEPLGRFRRLEAKLQRLLPGVRVTNRWSGQVIETNDGLPFIGEIAPRQFVATGFSGNGMTFGTLAALMATDVALGRTNPWAGLFDVGRTKIKGGLWDYLKENKDYPYYLLRDRIRGAEATSLDQVPRGEGRIVAVGGQKVAAYRDEQGHLSVRSAVCTHLGCLVRWNSAGLTWDCPCHGSRFLPTGEVLSGPAESPLQPAEVTEPT